MIVNLNMFMASSLVFVLVPGLDTIFVVNKSISQGRKAGIVATLGIATGVLFHTVLGGLGVAILIAKSPMLLAGLKYLGGSYLIFLAVKTWKAPVLLANSSGPRPQRSLKKVFMSGVFANILNPKVALFFISFFPQFINFNEQGATLGFFQLGLIYTALTVSWYSCLTFFASIFTESIQTNMKKQMILKGTSAFFFAALGVNIAVF
ncbi:MAG: LysE family translocator [Bacteriovoracaceae bacterium]|nr:LysE family translocator [Bacteriovoracaceae bacterium]